MKNIFEEYVGMVLLLLTVVGLVYYFRKQVFGDIAGVVAPVIATYKADIKTIQDTSIGNLAGDIWASITDKNISQAQFRENTAAIAAQIAARRAGSGAGI